MSPKFFRPPRRGEKRRRIRDMAVIGALVLGIAVVGYQLYAMPQGEGSSPAASVLYLILLDVNVLLVLALLFFVIRNVVKLVVERRKGVLGARFRTKITVALIGLSLLPTLVLFFAATSLLTRNFEALYAKDVAAYAETTAEMSQLLYKASRDRVTRIAERVAREAGKRRLHAPENAEALRAFLAEARATDSSGSIAVYGADGLLLASAPANVYADGSSRPPPSAENLAKALGGATVQSDKHFDQGLVLRAFVPLRGADGAAAGVVVVDETIAKPIADGMARLRDRRAAYATTAFYGPQIEKPYRITLVLVTAAIAAVAVWAGFYVSKGITGPVQELAAATKAVAHGDYDVRVHLPGEDEMSVLVDAFNRMAGDLKLSKERLDGAMAELRETAQEAGRRRAYMEIVLGNVTAGVVSVDASGRISTVNKSAARLFRAAPEALVGRRYEDLLAPEQPAVVREALAAMARARADSVEREVQIPLEDGTHTVVVSINRLADEAGEDLGLVAVFDDVTELVRAQRASAWREVARRIAHEIKNPLTPIQLSAQRLQRKYAGRVGEDRGVFDECIDTIVRQVSGLKVLVEEFSNFARLPATNPRPDDLNRILREATRLFAEAHPRVAFETELDESIPVFKLDAEQMRRVFTNILDNALDAIPGRGTVRVTSAYNAFLELARVEIANDGEPIPPETMGRLFEPYFSTKEGGTGLGLAIVKQIVTDHSGYIRVRSLQPRGTAFTIELPVRV